jgi:hypothetical protein
MARGRLVRPEFERDGVRRMNSQAAKESAKVVITPEGAKQKPRSSKGPETKSGNAKRIW